MTTKSENHIDTTGGCNSGTKPAPVEIDLSQPIPEKRRDPIIEVKRFMTSLLLETWQQDNPHYCIFTTEFHPCKEEGYDVAIYVTCGDLAAFKEHNRMVDTLIQLRADRNDADPDVVTEPPAITIGDNLDIQETDMAAPDTATPVVSDEDKKNWDVAKKNKNTLDPVAPSTADKSKKHT